MKGILDLLVPETSPLTSHGLVFAVEPLSKVRPEFDPLLPLHWEEIATDKERIKLSVDDTKYQQLDSEGRVHLVTVRDSGKLVGYYVGFIGSHLHYKNDLMCFTDVYFIRKEYRKGRTGINFLKFVEQSLRDKGVVKIFAGTKTHKDNSVLFEHLGYTMTEVTYTKFIGGK